MAEAHKDVTVVIASSEDESVFNCIDSIKGEANIVVSLTPSTIIETKLSTLQIPYVIVPRGNLGLTYNAGIEQADTNKVILMTDDATFNPGTIEQLSEALDHFDVCKPRIIFEHDEAKPSTKLIADVRDFANSSPTRAFNPGLALRKDTLDRLGGHFFDERVKWPEDAEFSYRLRRSNLTFGYIRSATINHPPVSLMHDLRGAFLIGVGKRRSVDLGLGEGNEDLLPTFKRVVSGETFRRKKRLLEEKGLPATFYGIIWDFMYNAGYSLRRVGLSDIVEEKIWKHFGRESRNINN